MPVDGDPPQDLVGLRVGLPDPQRRGVQQFDGGRPGLHQGGQRTRCAAEGLEHQQAGHRVLQQRHRAHDHGRDEGQGALAADHQVGQDVHRPGVVEQRVQPVAHGVLHRELLLDDPHRGGVAADPVPQPGQPWYSAGSRARSSLVGVGGAGVDHGAAGQHQDQRIQRVVGVRDRAAGHAAGVVGHDTAERAGDLAGRVGAELATEPGQPGVDLPHRGAGADPDPGAAVEDLDVPEVPAGVDQDPVGDRPGRSGWCRRTGTSTARPGRPRRRTAGRPRRRPRGVTTAVGVRAKCEASWPSASRSVARLRTCPGPPKAAPNAASTPAGDSGSVVLT